MGDPPKHMAHISGPRGLCGLFSCCHYVAHVQPITQYQIADQNGRELEQDGAFVPQKEDQPAGEWDTKTFAKQANRYPRRPLPRGLAIGGLCAHWAKGLFLAII